MLKQMMAGTAAMAFVVSGALAQNAPVMSESLRSLIFAQAQTGAPPLQAPEAAAQPDSQGSPDTPSAPGQSVKQDQPATGEPTDNALIADADPATKQLGDVIFLAQDEDQIRATDYIGKSVFNNSGKALGDVNDVVFDDAGGIVAAIVGVGGFLGMGEKEVGVSFAAIDIRKEEKGGVYLIFDTTKEALEAAPRFVDLAEQKVAQTLKDRAATDPAAAGTAVPPASGAAPASSDETPAAPYGQVPTN